MNSLNFAHVDGSWSDTGFALHALAVIKCHDSLQNEAGGKYSLRQLCDADALLCNAKQRLNYYYLLSFGRHSLKLLETYLLSVCRMTEQDMRQQVAQIETLIKADIAKVSA